ncbi:MAG: stalk domain-containing protein [Bacillota bacterium]
MRKAYPVLIILLVFTLFLPGPGQAGEQSSSGVKSLHFITEDGKTVSSGEVITLLPGEQFPLQARAFLEDGTDIIANSGADWSSSNPGVIAIPGGSFNYTFIPLEAGLEGTAVVTASFKGKTASVRITVSPAVSLDVSLDRNTSYKNAGMENGRVIMENGSAAGIYVTATLADGTKKEVNRLTRFEPKNPEIVSIGYGGYPAVRYNQLFALKEGNTEVTLTLNGVTTSLGVTVVPRKKNVPDQNPDAVVSFNDSGLESASDVLYKPQKTEKQLEVKSIFMAIPDAIHSVLTPIFPGDTVSVRPGGFLYLSPRAVYSNGEHGEIPDPAWTTSDPEVAEAGYNSVKGIKEGTATVTVAYRGHTTSFKVQVSPVVSTEVSAISPNIITEKGAMVMYGGDGKIVLNAVLDSGVRENVTRLAQWNSKDPEIAVVVEPGIEPEVTLYSRKEGAAQFTATFNGMTTGFTVKSRPYPPAQNGTPGHQKISVRINGVLQEYDQPPVIISGRTYVPLRGIFEALGAKVDWNEKLKTITATRDGTVTIRLAIDSVIAFINGRHITMDQPPMLINDRTMVPVRFVSEAMRYRVEWDEGSRTVLISEILIGPASGPPADEAKIYVLEEGLLKKVTDVQFTPIRFVEYGDMNTMVTGIDETGREKIFWLTKNKYTGEVSVTGNVFTGAGISRETLYSILHKRGFPPESIEKTYIAPYEPRKICWYAIAGKDNKKYYYCFDYYSGEVYVENIVPNEIPMLNKQ